MANGQVTTGFSKPYVALYANNEGTISYTSGQVLARGVEVSMEIETSEDNDFYADNIVAESDSGSFVSGTLTLTVDGLLAAAEKLIMGLPTAGSDGFMPYDDDQEIPDVGVGFIRRVMSDGVTSYIPYVFPRCTFQQIPVEAATQEAEIDWQTQELTANIQRAEDAKRTWQKVGAGETTETAAEAKIKTALGIQ